MTIKGLIAQLSKFGPNAEVRFYFPLHNREKQVAAMIVSGVALRLALPQKAGSDLLVAQSVEGDHLSTGREVVLIS